MEEAGRPRPTVAEEAGVAVADEAEIEDVRLRLEHDFQGALPMALIDLVWQEEQDRLAGATHCAVFPLAAERAARVRLRGLRGDSPLHR